MREGGGTRMEVEKRRGKTKKSSKEVVEKVRVVRAQNTMLAVYSCCDSTSDLDPH